MPYINQCSALVNATARELWGEDAISVKDTTNLVDLGNRVFASNADKDKFLNTLVDRIKRTVIRTLDISVDMPNLLLDSDAYFGILQKINVQPIPTETDNSWNIGEIDYTPTIWDIDKPNVSQKLFQNISTFTIPVTIPDVMYKSAFEDGKMSEFVQAIFSTIESCLIMYVNGLTHLVLCSAIAEKVKRNKAINLLAMYKTQFPSATVDADSALTDKDFLRYAGMIIRNYIKYMANPSVLYNEEGMVRATARDNMHVIMLSDFVSAFTSYYSADTYWQEMTSLPAFSEISNLMGSGTTSPNFATNSSFNIIPPSEKDEDSPTAISGSGIFCVLADRQAMGVTLSEEWSGVDRNNRERYSNYTFGVNKGYFLDLSENIVTFGIWDTASAGDGE